MGAHSPIKELYRVFTAAQILSTPDTSPEAIFRDRDAIKETYRDLVKAWHPDTNPGLAQALEVFQKIQILHKKAIEKSGLGRWEIPTSPGIEGTITFASGSSSFILRFQRKHTFALGEMYVSKRHVVYALDKKNRDLHDAFIRNTKFSYRTERVRAEMSRFLPPTPEKVFETDDRIVTVMPKTEDLLLLRDVMNHMGTMPPKHAVWVISRLYNIACYLRTEKISHNDISPDTIFISPEYHSVVLMGGWWYSSKFDGKLTALPKRSAKLINPIALKNKVTDARIDLNAIRSVGREMLGDEGGAMLSKNKDIPDAVTGWLRFPRDLGAYDSYKEWYNVLEKAYGERKFTVLPLTSEDVYGSK